MSETARHPSVFIGSSAEGHAIAEAIQVNLDRACEVVIWSQGIFGLGGGTLETLVEKADEFDFAVLVVTPDDMIHSRGAEQPSPRDNVLLELGLFMGKLGRTRTFVIFDRTAKIKMPSDMAGVTLADYQPHASGNLQAALGAASTKIKTAIQDLGVRERARIGFDVDQTTQFQVIADLLDESALQFIVLMHEQNVTLRRESISMLPGERVLFESRSGALRVTTHRVRYERISGGNVAIKSIMLEQVASCAMVRHTNPQLLVAAAACF